MASAAEKAGLAVRFAALATIAKFQTHTIRNAGLYKVSL
jgi:hypothetical protein